MTRIVLALLMGIVAAVRLDGQAPAAARPMESRVTIDYRAAPAAEVIKNLAAAAGLRVDIAAGTLRPVTVTLTNVKLRTALDAVCDNALCSWIWMVGDTSVRVTPLPSAASAALPARVSFSVESAAPTDVFRALAAAIDVPLTVEANLPNQQLAFNFKEGPTAEVLNLLCSMLQCTWDFDANRGLRIMRKR